MSSFEKISPSWRNIPTDIFQWGDSAKIFRAVKLLQFALPVRNCFSFIFRPLRLISARLFLSVLCFVLLGTAVLDSICVEAASPPFPNLVPNPGFEADDDKDGIPDGWRQDPPANFTSTRFKAQKGFSSNKSLFIEAGKTVAWKIDIKNIKPNRNYLLTFWVKREGWKDGEYPLVHIFGQKIRMNELFSWGRWRKVRRVVQAREKKETILAFSADRLSHGLAIDQVKLRELAFTNLRPTGNKVVTKGGPIFSWFFTPSDLVYRLKIELSPSPDLLKPTIIELMSPGKSGVRLLRRLPAGEWHWSIRAFLGAEEVAHSGIKSFRVPEGGGTSGTIPHHIRADPPYLPQPFFPIGMFDARPKGFPELKAAGFNSVLIGTDSKILKAAERNGLKAIISHKKMRDAEFSLLARSASRSPSFLGWYIEDEAEGRGVSPAAIWWKTASTRRFPPSHFTSLALLRSSLARYYGDAVDVVMVDPYPIPTQPLTWVSDSIEDVHRQLGPQKPVWAIIQAFSWGLERHYAKDKPGRFPTLAEERAMTYLAIVHGAQGIIFFADEHARRDSGHWANLKKLAGELNCLSLLLATNGKTSQPTLVSSEMDLRGKPVIHFLKKKLSAGNSPPANKGCPPLPSGDYLIAVNTGQKTANVHFNRINAKSKYATEIISTKKLSLKRGELRDKINPYGVRIWRLGKN